MALPFEDASFDVVSTGYGLRNVPELQGAIAEIKRVLRPGGDPACRSTSTVRRTRSCEPCTSAI